MVSIPHKAFGLTLSLLTLCLTLTMRTAAQSPPAEQPPRTEQTPSAGIPPASAQTSTAQLGPERRADILMARKMYREALDIYREAPQNSAVVSNKMGIAYHQMTQIGQARKHYEKAIKLDPKYSEAINNLGTVHYAGKSYRRAIGQYKKALKLAPNSASIYSNLGTAYFARKNYKEAAVAYKQALALDPEVFEHRSAYGVMLQERNVEERAKFHYYLAKTYADAGKFELALQYLRKALEEGYKERNKIPDEPEFVKLKELAEFQQILTLEPRVL